MSNQIKLMIHLLNSETRVYTPGLLLKSYNAVTRVFIMNDWLLSASPLATPDPPAGEAGQDPLVAVPDHQRPPAVPLTRVPAPGHQPGAEENPRDQLNLAGFEKESLALGVRENWDFDLSQFVRHEPSLFLDFPPPCYPAILSDKFVVRLWQTDRKYVWL